MRYDRRQQLLALPGLKLIVEHHASHIITPAQDSHISSWITLPITCEAVSPSRWSRSRACQKISSGVKSRRSGRW
jgi:hypothetical protein